MSTKSKTKSTSTTSQPSWITNESKDVINNANSIANAGTPTYNGQLVAPQNSQQTTGENNLFNNAYSWTSNEDSANSASNALSNYLSSNGVPSTSDIMKYATGAGGATPTSMSSLYGVMPYVNGGAATNATSGNSNPEAANAYNALGGVTGAASNDYNNSGAQGWNTTTAQQYMSPYEQTALNSQLNTMKQSLAQQQNSIDSQATQANAFGDARQSVASTLANQNADLQMANVEANGMNDAYNTALSASQNQNAQRLGAYATGSQTGLSALSALQQQQQLALSGVNSAANIDSQNYQNALSGLTNSSSAANQDENTALSGVSTANNTSSNTTSNYNTLAQLANALAASNQTLNANAANNQYAAGAASQNQQQTVDNAAYQQWLNSVNYPAETLALQEGALGSAIYPTTTTGSTTQTSSALGNIMGMVTSLAGIAGKMI